MKLLQALAITAWSTMAKASMGYFPGEHTAPRDALSSKHKRTDASASAPFFNTGANQEFDFKVDVTQTANGYKTKYRIDWPGDSSLNASLAPIFDTGNAKTNSMCITVISAKFPKSVVDKYDVDQPGSCTGPFGEQCATALQNAYELASVSDRPLNGSSECPTEAFSIDTLPPACQSMFDTTEPLMMLSLSTSYFNSSNKPATFATTLHDELNAYAEQTQGLQVGLFAAVHYGGSSYQSKAAAVCLVVDPKRDTDDTATDGTETTTTRDGAAAATRVPGMSVMVVAGLGVIAGVL